MQNFNKNDIYIVTGASSGIGAKIVELLNDNGATIVAIARNESKMIAIRKQCSYPENIFIEINDLVSDITNLPEYIKNLKDKYGKFKGIVHSAGIIDFTPLRMLDPKRIKEVFDINFYVPIMLTKGFSDKRCNVGEGASIVFISSIAAKTCEKAMLAYSSSKAALIAAAKVISRELSSQKIRVNTLCPGDIETEMTKKLEEMRIGHTNKYPWGYGKTEDVANFVMYLLSEESRWITGQVYTIDCGSI